MVKERDTASLQQIGKASSLMKHFSRQQIATGIALAFHLSGFIAIGLFQSELFIALTPLNLVVCAALIFWTQPRINAGFLLFCLLAAGLGFAAEYIGVNTGLIFGQYEYGDVLGPQWGGVPYLIGVQWLVTLYCIGVSLHMLHERLINRHPDTARAFPRWWLSISIIIDGALLAVLFDWLLEPVAINLGYWQWAEGEVPWLNYASWWGVSALIMFGFRLLPFAKQNLFAVHLLLIQVMFFLLLRTTLLW